MDKNLRAHGLIQAFSRTNRILNSVKTYGNIVSFRDLEQATNDALALFGNRDARGIALLRPYGEYYEEYRKRVEELAETFPPDRPPMGEEAQRAFVGLFGAILRLKRALEEFVVDGMKTTVPLHQKIIRDPAFQSGDYTIKWLERWLDEQDEDA